MYTKQDLLEAIEAIGVKRDDTLLVHSSMKALGEVENGAETVLDAFIEYMEPGLLIFPTHTWDRINDKNPVFDPATERSCVGILPNLFMKRPGVIRSWHPTHSVAALGKDAEAYTAGEEQWDTPCSRQGCWGKLYDRKARILFLGCSLRSNTLLHGVEEWNRIPVRLTDEPQKLAIRTPDGRLLERPLHRHYHPLCDVSEHYGKMEAPFLHAGIARKGRIGDAVSILCDAVGMVDLTTAFLRNNPDLFADDRPVPEEWYK